MKQITKEDDIEYIIRNTPGALNYLIKKGICGISCGETLSGTLESLAKQKDFSDANIEQIIFELNSIYSKY